MRKEDILFHTFIGIRVEVVNSSSRALIGLKGTVIDETKNMLVVETASGRKRIQKVACTFRFETDGGQVDVHGKKIAFRPEERPKKARW